MGEGSIPGRGPYRDRVQINFIYKIELVSEAKVGFEMVRERAKNPPLTEDTSIIVGCPVCGEDTPHSILKGQFPPGGGSFTATVACNVCGHTHQVELTIPGDVVIRLIKSFEGSSERSTITFPEDEVLKVGEEIYEGEHTLLIKAIEVKDGKRVKSARASEVETLWTVKYDTVPVKVSINRGGRTTSHKIYAHPDELFYIGDVIAVGRIRGVIEHVKTSTGMIHRGAARARDIVRVYCKIIKERHGQ